MVNNHLPMKEKQETWVGSLGQERSPEGRHGNPLQYSCLENLMDRGAWRAIVHTVRVIYDSSKESDTTEAT